MRKISEKLKIALMHQRARKNKQRLENIFKVKNDRKQSLLNELKQTKKQDHRDRLIQRIHELDLLDFEKTDKK